MTRIAWTVALVATLGLGTLPGCDKKGGDAPAAADEKNAGGGDKAAEGEKKAEGDKAAEKKAESGDPAGGKAEAGGDKKPAETDAKKPAAGDAAAKPAAGDPAGGAAKAPAPAAGDVKPTAVGANESYKATIARAIVAAMEPDFDKGFELFKKELHSKEIFPGRIAAYKRFNFPAMRRKVKLYLADDTKPEFKIVRTLQIDDKTIKVFVHNEKSMPTPCILQKDDKAKGEYRITGCSL